MPSDGVIGSRKSVRMAGVSKQYAQLQDYPFAHTFAHLSAMPEIERVVLVVRERTSTIAGQDSGGVGI